MLYVNVQKMSGHSAVCRVPEGATVQALKLVINDCLQVPPEWQRLITSDGSELPDSKELHGCECVGTITVSVSTSLATDLKSTEDTRMNTLMNLKQLGICGDVDAVRQCCEHETSAVRAHALDTLVKTRTSAEAANDIHSALRDPSAAVRSTALLAFARAAVSPANAIDKVAEFLNDEDFSVRNVAISILQDAFVDSEDYIVKTLRQQLRDRDNDTFKRRCACRALISIAGAQSSNIDHETLSVLLEELMKNDDVITKSLILTFLEDNCSKCVTPEVIAALRQCVRWALECSNDSLRQQAVGALECFQPVTLPLTQDCDSSDEELGTGEAPPPKKQRAF